MKKFTSIALGVIILIFALFSSTYAKANIEACPSDPAQLKEDLVCTMKLPDVRPTQTLIGKIAVYYKEKQYLAILDAEEPSVYKDIDDYLKTEAVIPIVMGPEGGFYMVDGHHTLSALWYLDSNKKNREKYNLPKPEEQTIYTKMIANYYRQVDIKTFWEGMIKAGDAFPYIIDPVNQNLLMRISSDDLKARLPKNLDPEAKNALTDYPMRSVIGLAKKWGYFKKPETDDGESINYYQFIWAECLAGMGYKPTIDKEKDRITVNAVYEAVNRLERTSDITIHCQSMIHEFGEAIIPARKSIKNIAEDVVDGDL